jgi:hypothetical protein
VADALFDRLARVVRLDPDVFAEVALDESESGGALAIVFGAALLEGLGRGGGLEGILLGVAEACLRWGLWVVAIHLGAVILNLGGGLAPLFRALGFAAAPFALGLLEIVPLVGGLAWLAKWALGFAAFSTAASEILKTELPTAMMLCGVALAAALLLTAIVL